MAASEWAGFVRDEPTWPADAMRFLDTRAPHIKMQYKRGYRPNANPIAYLESWGAVLDEPKVPAPPDGTTNAHGLVRFHQDAFTALKVLDWKHERSWLGPWTFHGAFKIYVLHEQRLWSDANIDAVTMPMGGVAGGYSFEAGWDVLVGLGVVSALPDAHTFADKMAVADQAHAEVQALAGLAGSRAIHVNSGIYLLGSK
ncbi:hypothetical protein [Sorangium sp. So ce362]|uniref:hypothetical protein n=1 Tax=Sorangium sp. So ce362 TaxID=3133303 RepID=UPI003F605B59